MGVSPRGLSDWALRCVAKNVRDASSARRARNIAWGSRRAKVFMWGRPKKGGAGGLEQFSMGSNRSMETPTRRSAASKAVLLVAVVVVVVVPIMIPVTVVAAAIVIVVLIPVIQLLLQI